MQDKSDTQVIELAIWYMKQEYPSFEVYRKEVATKIGSNLDRYSKDISVVGMINTMSKILRACLKKGR